MLYLHMRYCMCKIIYNFLQYYCLKYNCKMTKEKTIRS